MLGRKCLGIKTNNSVFASEAVTFNTLHHINEPGEHLWIALEYISQVYIYKAK